MKGITVEIGGDTTKLTTALKGVNIAVVFSVTAKWLKVLTSYSKEDKLAVEYFDTETTEMKSTEMYIGEFKAKLEKDTRELDSLQRLKLSVVAIV